MKAELKEGNIRFIPETIKEGFMLGEAKHNMIRHGLGYSGEKLEFLSMTPLDVILSLAMEE